MSTRSLTNWKPIYTTILSMGAIFILAAMSLATVVAGVVAKTGAGASQDHALNTKQIDEILGRSGEMKDGVYKVGFPRTDLQVTVDGVNIKAGLALGSWVAFKPTDDHPVTMGDLVLLEDEINPVLSKLETGGIEISAIHNHLLNEQPRVMYMHFMGHGGEEKLARAMKEALALTGTPLGPPPPTPPSAPSEDWKKIQEIIGVEGRDRGGVLQIGVPRKEKIVMAGGVEIPGFMGTATAINFQPSSKGVATTGDFVMTASEVNPVIRELTKADIHITALHSHMLDENPRLFFMHFWGNGDSVKLARGLRAALEKTNSAL